MTPSGLAFAANGATDTAAAPSVSAARRERRAAASGVSLDIMAMCSCWLMSDNGRDAARAGESVKEIGENARESMARAGRRREMDATLTLS